MAIFKRPALKTQGRKKRARPRKAKKVDKKPDKKADKKSQRGFEL